MIKRREGFSLMEMLTVVFIMAVLAGIMLPVLRKVREGGRITHARNEINQLIAAIQMYAEDWGTCPPDDGAAAIGGWGAHYAEGEKASSSLIDALESEGCAEFPDIVIDSDGNLVDPWSNPYRYVFNSAVLNGVGEVFNLYSAGPDMEYGTEDDITNW
jgi:general secretion pathway protein G